jgi:hypothetical protein
MIVASRSSLDAPRLLKRLLHGALPTVSSRGCTYGVAGCCFCHAASSRSFFSRSVLHAAGPSAGSNGVSSARASPLSLNSRTAARKGTTARCTRSLYRVVTRT